MPAVREIGKTLTATTQTKWEIYVWEDGWKYWDSVHTYHNQRKLALRKASNLLKQFRHKTVKTKWKLEQSETLDIGTLEVSRTEYYS